MQTGTLETRLHHVHALLQQGGALDEAFVADEVREIALAGSADAAVLAASITGLGVGCAKEWREALGWLVRAAEAGHAGAQAQLTLLSGASGRDWQSMTASVDVAGWSAARALDIVHDAPRIGVSAQFLDRATCAWMIERAAPLQESALVYDPVSGRAVADDVRTNSCATFALQNLDLVTLLIRERIANTMAVPSAHLERTSVFRYHAGQQFGAHVDYLTPSPQLNAEIRQWGQRPLTFLVYLNDDFDAGETHFLKIDRKLRGGVGDALFFRNVSEDGAPDEMTWHEGAPPTRGVKWLLSQFIRDKPQPLG